ncbi:carboxylesterase, partial [Nephila pilipes]
MASVLENMVTMKHCCSQSRCQDHLNTRVLPIMNMAGLEVLVWIHGGFLQWGSGHEPGICPSGRVAKRLNAVFVSFNYRLGALGFMALDVLSQMPQDARGNYGLWDQIVALQWVQHNIRAFGGDPEK